MIEYGAIYNKYNENQLDYIFCAFRNNDYLFISDALNNRIIRINLRTNKSNEIFINNWFPRWIQPINNEKLIFIDSKKKTIGELQNDQIINEKYIPMDKPKFVKLTSAGTYLVGGKGNKPLIEYDVNLNIIGKYLNPTFNIQSAEYIYDKLLICDVDRHQVLICDKEGNVFWSYGKIHCPGELKTELSTPKFACFYKNLFYIADGKNNRILCLDVNKKIKFIYKYDEYHQGLWWPSCLQNQKNELIITDSANCRIIQLSLSTLKSKQFGKAKIKTFNLNNPRGIEIYNDVFYLADTYNHRILELDKQLQPNLFFGGTRGNKENELFWPRAIRVVKNKYYIADSRNSRIICVDNKKHTKSIIQGYTYNHKFYKFRYPHDIDVYDDKILITDSSLNRVIEINSFGKCSWLYGLNGELNDPHNARRTIDGAFLISDTRNNRVIKVSNKNQIIYSISKTNNNNLKLPRWSEEIDQNILITDSGNDRILLVDRKGFIIKQYGNSIQNSGFKIRGPRCARKYKNHILISDTCNNRIILTDL